MSQDFWISSFIQTQLTVKADIKPSGENKACRTGCASILNIQVLQMPISKPVADQEVMYEIDGQSYWEIHGKSIGTVLLLKILYESATNVWGISTYHCLTGSVYLLNTAFGTSCTTPVFHMH